MVITKPKSPAMQAKPKWTVSVTGEVNVRDFYLKNAHEHRLRVSSKSAEAFNRILQEATSEESRAAVSAEDSRFIYVNTRQIRVAELEGFGELDGAIELYTERGKSATRKILGLLALVIAAANASDDWCKKTSVRYVVGTFCLAPGENPVVLQICCFDGEQYDLFIENSFMYGNTRFWSTKACQEALPA